MWMLLAESRRPRGDDTEPCLFSGPVRLIGRVCLYVCVCLDSAGIHQQKPRRPRGATTEPSLFSGPGRLIGPVCVCVCLDADSAGIHQANPRGPRGAGHKPYWRRTA